jgi:hypothetical protein
MLTIAARAAYVERVLRCGYRNHPCTHRLHRSGNFRCCLSTIGEADKRCSDVIVGHLSVEHFAE